MGGPGEYVAAIRVLASGSAGNCSVIRIGRGENRRVVLLDMGLSPRRTKRLLAEDGLGLDDLDAVMLTHLDHDHWRIGWNGALPSTVPVYLYGRHFGWGMHLGILPPSARAFEGDFDLACGARVRPILMDHDDLGVAAYRIDFAPGEESPGEADRAPPSLGFATDVGRVTTGFIGHFRGVGVLAIESNYCRDMQVESERPRLLKTRIMGGRGHLSNAETALAVERIGPRHVVFLHLSRECNRAELVADLHAGGEYEYTIADQDRPTRWVGIVPGGRCPVEIASDRQSLLWEGAR
jgi:ribonuclease BN (tRNA processing enzyme)